MIREVTMYQAVCDACGNRDDESDYYAWADPGQAVDVALASSGWEEFDGPEPSSRILCCPGCIVYDEDADEYRPRTTPKEQP